MLLHRPCQKLFFRYSSLGKAQDLSQSKTEMDTLKHYKDSRLSVPGGTRENPINLDGEDEGSRRKTFKSASSYGKAARKVRRRKSARSQLKLTSARSDDITIQSEPGLSSISQLTHPMLFPTSTVSLPMSTLSPERGHCLRWLRAEASKILSPAVSHCLKPLNGVNLTLSSPCHDFQGRE